MARRAVLAGRAATLGDAAGLAGRGSGRTGRCREGVAGQVGPGGAGRARRGLLLGPLHKTTTRQLQDNYKTTHKTTHKTTPFVR